MHLRLVSVFIFVCLFGISATSFGQELANITKDDHYMKLVKSEDGYSLIYSTVSSDADTEKQFIYSDLESIYAIISDGFDNTSNHQVIVKTSSDTIVKFDFRKVRGTKLLMIQQNNLTDNSFGSSSFFTKEDFEMLFNSTP